MDGVSDNSDSQLKRSDARRNRREILRTAFEVFGEMGVDAQMTDIAKAAGLGIGTVYRNFESKEALVNALVMNRLTGAAQVAKKAADEPDAWKALVDLIYLITDRQIENRVLSQFLEGRIAGSSELQKQRDIVYGMLDKILDRAKKSGEARPDVNIADIRMIMTSVAHLASNYSPIAQRLVRRYIGVVIDGLRAPGRIELPGPAVTIEQSEDAFRTPSRNPKRAMRRGRRAWPT